MQKNIYIYVAYLLLVGLFSLTGGGGLVAGFFPENKFNTTLYGINMTSTYFEK